MYALGQYDATAADSGLEQTLGTNEFAAKAYIRDRWSDFLHLSPKIIDLQHRAALLAGRFREAGDTVREAQAKDVISALGKLNVAHGKAVDMFHLEGIGEALGLSGYRGLGALPVIAGAIAFSSLALLVLWAFRSYDAQSRKLDLIEAGVLTPAEAAALDPGPAPTAFLGGVTEIGKLLLWGALAYLALQALQTWSSTRPRGRARRNPPLEVWHTNPPGVIGTRVWDLRYRHAEDGLDYVHDFGPGVELEALDDGSVILRHAGGLPLWDDFELVEE